MVICVLGTSNSILKRGWYDGLVSATESEVHRFSLGGAPFIQLACFIDNIHLLRPDYIIIESNPNDETFYPHVGDVAFFKKLYSSLIGYLSSIATVVCLQMPTRTWFNKEHFIRDDSKNVAVENGGYFLCISSLIVEVLGKDADAEKLFLDDFHLNTDISHRIGIALAAVLARLPTPIYRTLRIRRFQNPFSTHSGKGASLKFDVSDSIVQERFLDIGLMDTITLDPSLTYLGFLFNTSVSSGVLHVKGRPGGDRFLIARNQQNPKPVVMFQCIPNGMQIASVTSILLPPGVELMFQSEPLVRHNDRVQIGRFLAFDDSVRADDPSASSNNADPDLRAGLKTGEISLIESAIDRLLT